MTAQFAENLVYKGQEYSMCTQPLGSYFALTKMDPGFESNCTALWRGYIGSWEILDDHLYLVKLSGTLKDGTEASVATLFPDFPDRVFAHWFSGKIRLPQGKLLNYVHMGYGSTYENDLILHIRKGIVMHTELKHNGVSNDPHAPEGFVLGAMKIFPTEVNDSDIKF